MKKLQTGFKSNIEKEKNLRQISTSASGSPRKKNNVNFKDLRLIKLFEDIKVSEEGRQQQNKRQTQQQ